MAAARLFGPPSADDPNGRASHVDEAKLVAALVALGAKMAKADGQVRDEDILAFRQVFRTDPQTEATIGRFFNLARQTTLGYKRYARIVTKAFRAQPGLLEDVLDGLFQILVSGGDQTHVGRDGMLGANRRYFLSLQRAEQFGLQVHRQLADFVEEQRPALCCTEIALSLGGGAGKRALHVPE